MSAVTANTVTISGPPRTVSALYESSERLKSSPHFSLPIYGPYHASHLFESGDLVNTVNDISPQRSPDIASRPYLTPVISTKTGEPIEASSYSELMTTILNEILESPLRLNIVVDQIISILKDANCNCRISNIGPANVGNAVSGAIQKGANCKVTVEDFAVRWPKNKTEAYATAQRETSPGIAIVGYSGRFPGAENAEALWDVLEQGLDMVKEVRIYWLKYSIRHLTGMISDTHKSFQSGDSRRSKR